MRKFSLFFSLLLLTSVTQADQICGYIYESDSRFYVEMNGNAHAQLNARDTVLFKPLTALKQAVGQTACLQGDWVNNYVFEVLRVN